MNRRKNRKAVTLVEIMIAMLLFAIILAIGYVVFLFVFKGSKIVTSINLEDKIAQANTIILISVIIAIIGLVCQLVNLVFSYLLKDEE